MAVDKFLGRLTFGFLLGQVAPGFFMVTAFWLLYAPDLGVLVAQAPATIETQTPPWLVLLVIGSLIGVLLDQLNWAAGGWQMAMVRAKKWKLHKLDKLHSIVYILAGPIGIVLPVMSALLISRVSELTVKEFLPKIDPDRFEQWEWLQGFYLYSAQFCANSALAAAILFIPILLSETSCWWAIGLWFGTGTLTLLDARAFDSLAEAEHTLVEASKPLDTSDP